MKVTYITYYSKNGSADASFNRISLLNNGLCQSGADSKMMILTIPNTQNRMVRRLFSIVFLLRIIAKLALSAKGDCVIIYGEMSRLNFVRRFKRKGVKLIVERNEYSTYQYNDNLKPSQVSTIRQFEKSLFFVDGFITCSHYLERYYRQFTNLDCDFAIIPLVVDQNKFKPIDITSKKYIAYCGDFGGNKDGLPTLLKSYAMFLCKYPDYKLYLIGDTSEQGVMDELTKQIKELNLNESIVFTGRVQHDQMPKLLGAAALLVLARPANKQAEGGIPSKLAEYLSTGRPTLVTRVGELDHYLTHKKDVFFATPDSVEDFANKMIEIFKSYDFAQQIAKVGCKSAMQFDYKIQSKILYEYLIKISNK